ncbi:MAG: EAL domain-containing protein [Gammaproteobacteria bacterium]|nr:EAL domain-containing protein [Gammaproteobacteria bacterium]
MTDIRFTILIVDDNENNLFTLNTLLKSKGDFKIIQAGSGEAALVAALEYHIDLILLDVQMPVMDGFETAQHLKMTARTKHIPIIFITAVFKADEFRNRGYAVGAVDYLTKPIDDNQLLNRIRLYQQIFEREQNLNKTVDMLQDSESRLEVALEAGQEALWDWNLQTGSMYLSPRWEEMLGYRPGSLKPVYKSYEERIHSEDLPAFVEIVEQLTTGTISHFNTEQRLQCADDNYLWIQAHGKVAENEFRHRIPKRVIGTHTDITARKKTELELQRAAQVIETMPDGVMILDVKEQVVSINPTFTPSTGYNINQLIGSKSGLLKSGRHDDAFFDQMRIQLKSEGHWQGEIWNRRASGEIYPEWLNATTILDSHGQVKYYVCIYSDLSSQEHIRRHLHHLAYYDVLTGLPNRELFKDRLLNNISIARREQKKTALMFIDLDRFKTINDSLGHTVGDQLLQKVSERFKHCLRESDTVARLGGDEFTVIIAPFDNEKFAANVAAKIIEALISPIEISENQLYVTASIGIGIYPIDSENPETLLRNADAAMYHAKSKGRNNYQFYSSEMTALAIEHFNLEADLRVACTTDQFQLFYQPLVELPSNTIIGAEALIRWVHPDRGLIGPDKFIKVAEETGMIVDIDKWVMNEACRQFVEWQSRGYSLKRIAVNISGFEIEHGGLVTSTQLALSASGIAPHQLELEISEGFIVHRDGLGIETLNGLNKLGVGLAIDDFGTGYSSLSSLRKLPVSRLKIDKSFVDHIVDEDDDAAIARAVLALGKSLSLIVIAEGIETEMQNQILISEGCAEGQGYLFGKPVPAAEFEALLSLYKSKDLNIPQSLSVNDQES